MQPVDGLPTAQTCFFQLRLPPYSSQQVMAERLRYAIQNCRSIDMDNYMLSRNADTGEGSDTEYWELLSSIPPENQLFIKRISGDNTEK